MWECGRAISGGMARNGRVLAMLCATTLATPAVASGGGDPEYQMNTEIAGDGFAMQLALPLAQTLHGDLSLRLTDDGINFILIQLQRLLASWVRKDRLALDASAAILTTLNATLTGFKAYIPINQSPVEDACLMLMNGNDDNQNGSTCFCRYPDGVQERSPTGERLAKSLSGGNFWADTFICDNCWPDTRANGTASENLLPTGNFTRCPATTAIGTSDFIARFRDPGNPEDPAEYFWCKGPLYDSVLSWANVKSDPDCFRHPLDPPAYCPTIYPAQGSEFPSASPFASGSGCDGSCQVSHTSNDLRVVATMNPTRNQVDIYLRLKDLRINGMLAMYYDAWYTGSGYCCTLPNKQSYSSIIPYTDLELWGDLRFRDGRTYILGKDGAAWSGGSGGGSGSALRGSCAETGSSSSGSGPAAPNSALYNSTLLDLGLAFNDANLTSFDMPEISGCHAANAICGTADYFSGFLRGTVEGLVEGAIADILSSQISDLLGDTVGLPLDFSALLAGQGGTKTDLCALRMPVASQHRLGLICDHETAGINGGKGTCPCDDWDGDNVLNYQDPLPWGGTAASPGAPPAAWNTHDSAGHCGGYWCGAWQDTGEFYYSWMYGIGQIMGSFQREDAPFYEVGASMQDYFDPAGLTIGINAGIVPYTNLRSRTPDGSFRQIPNDVWGYYPDPLNLGAGRGRGEWWQTAIDSKLRTCYTSPRLKVDSTDRDNNPNITSRKHAALGRVVLSGADDANARIWSAQQLLDTLSVGNSVRAVAFNPDSTRLAVGRTDGYLRVYTWNGTSWSLTGTVAQFDGPVAANWVWSLAWRPDGSMLASAGEEGGIKIWNVPAMTLYNTIRHDIYSSYEENGGCCGCGWCGCSLGCVKSCTVYRYYNGHTDGVESGGVSCSNTAAYSPVRALAWKQSGSTHYLISGSTDDDLRVWNPLQTNRLSQQRRRIVLATDIYALDLSRDGQWLAIGQQANGSGPEVRIWNVSSTDVNAWSEIRQVETGATVRGVAFSPAKHDLAILQESSLLRIWNLSAGDPAAWAQRTSATLGTTGRGVSWSRDGTLIAAAVDQGIVLRDAYSGAAMTTHSHGSAVWASAWSDTQKVQDDWDNAIGNTAGNHLVFTVGQALLQELLYTAYSSGALCIDVNESEFGMVADVLQVRNFKALLPVLGDLDGNGQYYWHQEGYVSVHIEPNDIPIVRVLGGRRNACFPAGDVIPAGGIYTNLQAHAGRPTCIADAAAPHKNVYDLLMYLPDLNFTFEAPDRNGVRRRLFSMQFNVGMLAAVEYALAARNTEFEPNVPEYFEILLDVWMGCGNDLKNGYETISMPTYGSPTCGFQNIGVDLLGAPIQLEDGVADVLHGLLNAAFTTVIKSKIFLGGMRASFYKIGAAEATGIPPKFVDSEWNLAGDFGQGTADHLVLAGTFDGDLASVFGALSGAPARPAEHVDTFVGVGGAGEFLPVAPQADYAIHLSPAESAAHRFSTGAVEFRLGADWGGLGVAESAEWVAYSWRLNGGFWSPYRQGERLQLPRLPSGRHLLEVKARAPDGRVDPTPARVVFYVDNVVPDLRLFDAEGRYLEPDTRIDAAVVHVHVDDNLTAPADLSVQLRTGAGNWRTLDSLTIDLTSLPNDGERLEIRAVDAVGNVRSHAWTLATAGGRPASGGCGVGGGWASPTVLLVVLAIQRVLRRRREVSHA